MKKSRAIGGRSLRKEPERTASSPLAGLPPPLGLGVWSPAFTVRSLTFRDGWGGFPRRSVSLAEFSGNLPEWFGNLPQPARNLHAWFSNLPRPAGNLPERFRKPAIYPPIIDKYVKKQQLTNLNLFQTSNLN
jgi:hypothetical protein